MVCDERGPINPSNGKAGIGDSWPSGMAVVGMRGGKLTDLDTKRIDHMLVGEQQPVQLTPDRGRQREIQELQENLALADHRAFAAEVAMRRAQQKRRNQKVELKRLHAAINEKNNQIRNAHVANAALVSSLDNVAAQRMDYAQKLRRANEMIDNLKAELDAVRASTDSTGGM